jgi:hypothetical protein
VALRPSRSGDDVSDLILGAYSNDISGAGTNAGVAYLIFGNADGSFGEADATGRRVIDLANLDPDVGFVVRGTAGNQTGFAVNTAGDINNDGYDDVLVGASTNGAVGFASVIMGHAGTQFGTATDAAGRSLFLVSDMQTTITEPPQITGTAEAGAVITLTITPEGGTAGEPIEIPTDPVTGDWSYTAPVDMPDGNYTVTIFQTDRAGNVSDPESQEFFIGLTNSFGRAAFSLSLDDLFSAPDSADHTYLTPAPQQAHLNVANVSEYADVWQHDMQDTSAAMLAMHHQALVSQEVP